MLRSVFLTIFLVFSCLVVFAQNTGSISGKVTDSLLRPQVGATVLLVTGAKDVPVKSALSDDKGVFVVEKIKFSSYKLIVSMTGFKESSVTVILNEEKKNSNAGTIKLLNASANLQGIIVTSQRPPVERKIDRTVVN